LKIFIKRQKQPSKKLENGGKKDEKSGANITSKETVEKGNVIENF